MRLPILHAQPSCRDPPVTQTPHPIPTCSRRAAHLQLAISIAALSLCSGRPAHASLVRFPADALNNRYILIRAGESEAEAQGYVLTNPVSKTSMSNALSHNGKQNVMKKIVPQLNAMGACEGGCWIWPSMTQNSYQTAEILAAVYGISRNKVVPEFSKIDLRGVGAFEGGRVEAVAEEIALGDAASPFWKPPKAENGTPNESAADVLVRGRELLSLLETQYLGDTVLIISPDSDNLSILQAGVMGVDLTGHRQFKFDPGDVRELQLGTMERDDSPRQFACPNPPLCR